MQIFKLIKHEISINCVSDIITYNIMDQLLPFGGYGCNNPIDNVSIFVN